jgi:alpha-beta hydrolase superfamily lysophospholipase
MAFLFSPEHRMPSTETHFDLTANDGHTVEAHRWQGPTQRAIIQLAHGMGEHSLRYRPLADALTQAGYVVYANEHRGHGKGAAARDELGEFGPRGFAGLVDDMALLSRHVRGVHPGLPLILVGHSMGSFATQYYLVKHSELLSGAVLSGTTALDLLGAALQSGFKLEDMNAALPDVRTPFDWLSRDPAQVDAYIADPLCGFTVSAEGMGSMFANLADLRPPRCARASGPSCRCTCSSATRTRSATRPNGSTRWCSATAKRGCAMCRAMCSAARATRR